MKVPKDRILRARFAYRDKNVAKRRINPETPPKPKARLCVGGHRDPDLAEGALNTEAPTASKAALTTLMFLASHASWKIAAGDVEAAFLNGVEARRGLYFEPPVDDLPDIPKGSMMHRDCERRLWAFNFAKALVGQTHEGTTGAGDSDRR